jgi:glycerol kinase
MQKDAAIAIPSLKVDGGMVANELLMQFQADILGIPVILSEVSETTALGACYAAGLATGFWEGTDQLRENWRQTRRWDARMSAEERERLFAAWKKAVSRSFDWLE